MCVRLVICLIFSVYSGIVCSNGSGDVVTRVEL